MDAPAGRRGRSAARHGLADRDRASGCARVELARRRFPNRWIWTTSSTRCGASSPNADRPNGRPGSAETQGPPAARGSLLSSCSTSVRRHPRLLRRGATSSVLLTASTARRSSTRSAISVVIRMAAKIDRVAFTPTLVKRYPEPRMWLLGTLRETDLVADLLRVCGVDAKA